MTDSGSTTPYSIMKDLTLCPRRRRSPIPTMIYGDPANYLLGLFGGFTIRIERSYKAKRGAHHSRATCSLAATWFATASSMRQPTQERVLIMELKTTQGGADGLLRD